MSRTSASAGRGPETWREDTQHISTFFVRFGSTVPSIPRFGVFVGSSGFIGRFGVTMTDVSDLLTCGRFEMHHLGRYDSIQDASCACQGLPPDAQVVHPRGVRWATV